MNKPIPKYARVVIIGGGIIGCSTAYHLAQMGCKDVVLLEQYQLTAGSTWHAAGAIGQLRSNANVTRLLAESVAIYDGLEKITEQATGWVKNGSLRLALTEDRRSEFEIAATIAHSFGVEFEMISADEAGKMIPQMNVSDVLCAAYVPSDGVGNPSDITQSLAKGARNLGVKIIEGIKVKELVHKNNTIQGVKTDQGDIACEILVNCGGIWAPEIGRMANVTIPLQPSHHQYVVTEKIEGLQRFIPSVRDPDKLTYFKEEVGGLSVGGYELNPIPFRPSPIPDNHEFKLMNEETEHFMPLMMSACERFPDLETTGVRQWFNGVEAFTEDGMFIMGEAPECRNFFVGAGFNAFGIAAGGGAGKALAYWILNDEPPFDLWAADIRRFGAYHKSPNQVLTRALEGQAGHYKLHYPFEEKTEGRNLRRSPVYDRLKHNGACFGTKFGWERPNWFAATPQGAQDVYSFGRQNWFEYNREEHLVCRNAAVLFDQSSFAKYKIIGPDAEAALQYIGAANMRQPDGKIIYTPLLNQRGGIESDLTITKLSEEEFLIITGTGSAVRDFVHIKRNIPEGLNAYLLDVTSAYSCLSLMGPKARDILAPTTENNIENDAFPLGYAKEITVAGAPVLALRVAFVGELGWEIYIPSEYTTTVYDALKSAGSDHGIRDAGYRTIDSCRLEKARRLWGHEIGPDYSPLEAGLGFAVDLSKDDFIGKDALLKAKKEGVTRRLCSFTIDDPTVVLYGLETIYRNGERMGWLSSAGFGHSIGKSIGLGYIDAKIPIKTDWINEGEYELEVRAKRIPAKVHTKMLYDPENLNQNI